MQRFRGAVVAGLFVLGGILVMRADEPATQSDEKQPRVLRHVVMFKFKEGATEEQIRRVEREFSALPEKIDAIESYEWGTNNSPEGRAKGFTHCFLVTFRDEAGREEYLPHAAHQAFVEVALPVIDDVLVVDYWTPGKKTVDEQ